MMDGVVDFEVWEGEDAPPRDLLLEKVKDCDGSERMVLCTITVNLH